MTGRHSEAVTAALEAGSTRLSPEHAPLIELCKVLAEQMDAAGADGPSTRLSAAYLSGLKDLARALAAAPRRIEHSKLEEMRRLRPVPRPSKRGVL